MAVSNNNAHDSKHYAPQSANGEWGAAAVLLQYNIFQEAALTGHGEHGSFGGNAEWRVDRDAYAAAQCDSIVQYDLRHSEGDREAP